jgi:hypothetical protein
LIMAKCRLNLTRRGIRVRLSLVERPRPRAVCPPSHLKGSS